MGFTRIMHVKSHLLYYVGDVKPGDSEALESPNKAIVGSGVIDRGAHVGGGLGLSIDRYGAGLVVAHASMLKDVLSVLALV
jgi:hypothetical protein